MKSQLFITLLISLSSTRAKDEDLPLCPTNFQFFPQSLPMHCRMPTGADFPSYPGMPGFPTMQPPSADKQPMPMPVPMPPGMPGPMPIPMPGPMMPMPGPIMPMPGPMMPMPGPAPGHKLPVIVMPFYSPDTSHKKPERPRRPGGPGWMKPKRLHESAETSSDTDRSSDASNGDASSENGWWKGKKHGWRKNGRRSNKGHHTHHSKRRHNKKKKDLLTPLLQYVTNDGYVIYEKTISKGEAKNWLRVNKEEQRADERNVDKNDEGFDASVHEEPNIEVKEETINNRGKSRDDYEDKDDERDKEDEKDRDEPTTQANVRRHHRKGAAPPINKLLPKRAF